MMKKNKIEQSGLVLNVLLAVAMLLILAACGTEESASGPEVDGASFIPTPGRKYVYQVVSEGSTAEAVRWVSAETDSLGIHVSTMRTEISAFGQTVVLNDNIFSIAGKTYSEIKLPEAWHTSVMMLDALPDVDVISTEVVGYPAYITMDNTIREGSRLEVSGPIQQEQHVRYTDHDQSGMMQQVILTHPGVATVETVTVPAGSFVCNKFLYQVSKTIEITLDGHTDTMTGVEEITLWMAHGVGMVKQESNSESVMLMPDATGGVKLVKSSSSSTTTLQDIR